MKILFYGDSVTEWGKTEEFRKKYWPGYVNFTVEILSKKYPDAEFINRGISGNRSKDLVERFDRDLLPEKPDIVCLLIGINDTWRAFDRKDPTTAEAYYENVRTVLSRIKNEVGARILMVEPFFFLNDDRTAEWHPDLNAKIVLYRRLAREFAEYYIPMNGIYAAATANGVPDTEFSDDGVHPNIGGAKLLAKCVSEKLSEMMEK